MNAPANTRSCTEGPFHVFGVRHHGPGSARSLSRALQELQPDCVLIEGPPEADDLLFLAGQPEMRPPVALLLAESVKKFTSSASSLRRDRCSSTTAISLTWTMSG